MYCLEGYVPLRLATNNPSNILKLFMFTFVNSEDLRVKKLGDLGVVTTIFEAAAADDVPAFKSYL